MTKRLLIDATHPEETRVVVMDGDRITDYDFVSSSKQQIKGNIYLAKITRVEPSLQAAFVEYGGGKQGFLPFAEIHPDYYQIPMSDRLRLMEEAAKAMEEDEGEEEGEDTAPSEAPDGVSYDTQEPAFPQSEFSTSESVDTLQPEAPAAEYSAPHIAPPLAPVEIAPDTTAPLHIEGAADHNAIAAPFTEEHAPPYIPAQALEAGDFSVSSEPLAYSGEEPRSDTGSEEEKPVQAEEVETRAEDDPDLRRRRKPNYSRRYKIQEVIKRNQIVLVQVIKEERGNKGVSLTTYISLAGRYCVLMPNSPKDGGISRKIANSEDRRRLKQMAAELKVSEGMSAIIRTAGIDRSDAEIRRDYDYLVNLWNDIREQTISSTAPAMIYEESTLAKRSIRDLYNTDIEEVLVQGEEAFHQAKEFMKQIVPSHAPRVKLYKDPAPLFYAYEVEEQLNSMHDTVVRLRSGGYIVINPTEALISIDVNSGRSTGERNIEETATKTNFEAANEIARQLRLRDLAGLIVIDFIDMNDSRNRRNIERALKDALKPDRAKIQIGRISPFGLLEMSRQRLHPSVSEVHNVTCPHCLGKGMVRSAESISIQIIRSLERDASSGIYEELRLVTTAEVGLHLLNFKREGITAIEQKYGIRIGVVFEALPHNTDFRIEKRRTGGHEFILDDKPARKKKPRRDLPPRERSEENRPEAADAAEPAETGGSEHAGEGSEEDRARRSRGGRRRRGGRDRFRDRDESRPYSAENREETGSGDTAATEEGDNTASGESSASGEGEGERNRRGGRRNRGGRGRNKWRDRDGQSNDNIPQGENAYGASDAPASEEFRRPPVADDSFIPRPLNKAPDPVFIPEPRALQARETTTSELSVDNTSSGSSDKPTRKGWWRRIVE